MGAINGLAGAAIGAGAGAGYVNGPIQKLVATTAPAFTSYNVQANDYTILVDATAAVFGVVLPPAAQCGGREYNLKKIDASGNAVNITDASGANVEGASTKALAAQYSAACVQSDGTSWWYQAKI